MTGRYSKEYMDSHAGFGPISIEHHQLVPQDAVKACVLPKEDRHNAIWDYFKTAEGHHYFSNCAEGNFTETFELYEYFPKTNTVKKLFNFADVAVTYPKAIRASKVHTSMCDLEDGRVIMATHSTAAGPGHPVWMIRQYYNHLWEGYPGSNILILDPKTEKVEDLGIPVRRESIYGGVYCPKAQAYFMGSYIRGHVYRLDLKNRHVTDYGQVLEGHIYCLKLGPDGNVYFSSHSGDFMRINAETLKYEDLGINIKTDWRQPEHIGMFYGANGPDGRMYTIPVWTDTVYAYDTKINKMEVMGSVMPEELAVYPWKGTIYGLAFDADGVLWYGLKTMSGDGYEKNGLKNQELGFYLASWDLLRGKKPVYYGIIGVADRAALTFSEAHIDGSLFIGADTNHWFDPVAMIQFDMDKVKANHAAGVKGPVVKDSKHFARYEKAYELYPGDFEKDITPVYDNREKEFEKSRKYQTMADEFGVTNAREKYITKFWRIIGYENSNIISIQSGSDSSFTVVCGITKFYEFTVKKGRVLSQKELLRRPADHRDGVTEKYGIPGTGKGLNLPANAGRRWIAEASAEVPWHDGSFIVGTKDGLLSMVKNGRVFSFGGLSTSGPVRDLCVNASKTKLWGVAGDVEDLGMLFTYDDENGLVQIGPIEGQEASPDKIEVCKLNVPCAVAVYGEGSVLAVGSEDYKAALIEYYF